MIKKPTILIIGALIIISLLLSVYFPQPTPPPLSLPSSHLQTQGGDQEEVRDLKGRIERLEAQLRHWSGGDGNAAGGNSKNSGQKRPPAQPAGRDEANDQKLVRSHQQPDAPAPSLPQRQQSTISLISTSLGPTHVDGRKYSGAGGSGSGSPRQHDSVLSPPPVASLLDPETGNFTMRKDIVEEVQRCFRNSGNLFIGHSHIGAIGNAFCQLLGFDLGVHCREKAPPSRWHYAKNGIQAWTEDATRWQQPNRIGWRRSMDPYLTLEGRIQKNVKKKRSGSTTVGGRYDNMLLGTALWDLIYRGTHPDVLYTRTLESLRKMIVLYNNNSMTSSRSVKRQNTMIVYLPHYHRPPSWPSRVPCHDASRVLAYHRAVEAATVTFHKELLEENNKNDGSGVNNTFTLNLLIMDVYQWTKESLLRKTDYLPDGNHLTPERAKNLAVALLLHPRNPLCGADEGNTTQGRLHRVLDEVSIKELHRDENLLRPPNPQVLSTYMWNQSWPSAPSCETHRGELDSFFHTSGIPVQRRPGWNAQWFTFKNELVAFYLRKNYPMSEISRAQLVHELLGNGGRHDPVSAQQLECFRNLGLSENATTWAEPEGNPGFVSFTLQQQVDQQQFILRGGKGEEGGDEQKDKKKFLPVPICTCASLTTLFPAVASAKIKVFSSIRESNSTTTTTVAAVLTQESITEVCSSRVTASLDFLRSRLSQSLEVVNPRGVGKATDGLSHDSEKKEGGD